MPTVFLAKYTILNAIVLLRTLSRMLNFQAVVKVTIQDQPFFQL